MEPDLDGDGRADLAVLIDRVAGSGQGLALCLRKDKRLTIVNATDSTLGGLGTFLRNADWWNVDGRTIVIGTEDARSIKVHLDEHGSPIVFGG
ncbi:MAG: hypothetical protein AAGA68_23125 [Pseudomonadota bacterium]